MDQNTIHEQVDEEFACDHPQSRLTVFTASNGTTHYREQCVRCGATTNTIRKAELSPGRAAGAVPYDADLPTRWWRAKNGRREELRESRNAERDAWYQEYLRSPEWARRRALVLQRAGGKCEGCLSRRATEVHHTTYDHVGQELLFELVALCSTCHRTIHKDKATSRRMAASEA